MNVPAKLTFNGFEFPICTRCNRAVETVEWETPIEDFGLWDGTVHSQNTGELIVTVRCHGATWKASNWRGIIPTP